MNVVNASGEISPNMKPVRMNTYPVTSISGPHHSNKLMNGNASQPAAPLLRPKSNPMLSVKLSARPRCQRMRWFFSTLSVSGASVQQKLGFASDPTDKANYEEAKAKIQSALKDYFRPEFLNRLDEIITFDILSPEAIREIVGIQVGIITKRLAEKEMRLELSPAVYDLLSKEGYNPQYGARPLKRLIQSKILTPIASLMVSKGITRGASILIGLKGGELTFDIKKPRKAMFAESFVMPDSVEV